MTGRYENLFSRLKATGEGAFIPFSILGDPDPETGFELIKDIVDAGADSLELGLPFSDPTADGPTIQKAGQRALASGATVNACLGVVQRIRGKYPDLPIGLLVYANLIEARGVETFFESVRHAGVDSVLAADIPEGEIAKYRKSAKKTGVKSVLILPLDSGPEKIERIVQKSEGYLYLLSRRGITGTETKAGLPKPDLINRLESLGSAPPVLGFGISKPDQVREALKAGCRGVISGSAVVEIIEKIGTGGATRQDLKTFIRAMKAATLPS